MYNYKILIAYDGTRYSGWQIQPNAVSIQAHVQEAIRMLVREDVSIVGSGRTDAGVHAVGQVAHFKCNCTIDSYRFLHSVNSLLPKDIRVLTIELVDLHFHAQRSAISKSYSYHLCLEPRQNPFRRLYSYHIYSPCNLDLLAEAAQLFLGERDFTSFTNEASEGIAAKDPVRTMTRLEVQVEPGGACLIFEADGVLYKMVRTITGTLLEVACGKRSIKEIPQIFEARDRRRAGQAAPPHGLFLMRVDYPAATSDQMRGSAKHHVE